MVTSLDDIYNVGTFVQISEMVGQGDRVRMIIQGIRRYVWHTGGTCVMEYICISEFK